MKRLLAGITALGMLASSAVAAFIPNEVGGALAGITNETVYLMCYHEGYYPAGGNSGIFISWSTNGYNFAQLNDGHPVFVPPEFPGDDADNSDGYQNLTRDPSMIYGPDGKFHAVYTSDINSRSFGYAESEDLVHWSNVKLVQIWDIWDAEAGNVLTSVDHTWAPEWFYNEDNGNYMVIFSSGVNGGSLRMWYTETSDFETFSVPQELYGDPSTTVIDGSMAKIGDSQYVMVAVPYGGTLWTLDSTSPYGPWTPRAQSTLGTSGQEGPNLINIGGTWHLYYDNFGYGDDVFGMAISTDDGTNWTDVTGLTTMPTKADVPDYGYDGGPPHHCTVFAAPLSALDAFKEPFTDSVTNFSSLVCRWSFDEATGSISTGTTVTDSVSGAQAIVNGSRAEFTGTGLLLPGDTTGTGDAAYIDLPNDIISALTNLTLEIWATPLSSQNWQRLFSFGRTEETGDGGGEWNGPATSATSAQIAMYWSINVGTDINKQNCAMRDYTDSNKDAVSGTCIDTVAGTRYHYVFTFEDGVGFFGATGGRMTFYRDGYQIGWRDVSFRLQDIEDVNNWLGRSQWSWDSNSNVEYDEVRIYSDALSWHDIYGHYVSGPDVPWNAGDEPWAATTGYSPSLNPVYAGTPVTLSASVSGAQPITYTWQTDNMSGGSSWSALAGSSTNTYLLDTTGLSAGTYQFRLVVANAFGSYTNTLVTIYMASATAPVVVSDTAFDPSDEVLEGESVTVSASFEGTLPISYQWRLNGIDIPGATSDSYTFTADYADAGSYSLVASNVEGTTSSTPTALSVAAFIPNEVGGALAGVTNETIYLMCYHEGYYPAGGSSGVFLSWSTNGYDFSPLNDGHPSFVPPEFPGDDADTSERGLVRDPSITYGPDGLFHLVYTSAIWSRSFGYAESPDLTHWSNVKLVQIWSNTTDSVGVTWAPEVFYDEGTSEYTIVFSSDVAGGTRHMYYTKTTDFENFDDPLDFYENPTGTWEQIDGCVAKVSVGHYMMAYKDNAQIWILDGDSPVGPWTNRRQATVSGDEGPCLLKIGDTWYLYFDNYGYGDSVFGLATSTDTTNWTDVTWMTDMPAKADVPDYGYDGGPPHHCTVFEAPLSALGAFTEPLQDNVTNLSSLVYRWSFNDAAGSASDSTTIPDSVSGVEAVVVGNRASFTGTGLLLPGDTDGTGDAAYLDLPAGIISTNADLTVEIWATAIASKSWQRLFSFGDSSSNVLFWSINQGTDNSKQRLLMQLNDGTTDWSQSDTCIDSVLGTRYHWVFTFEDGVGFFGASGGRISFYRDGYQVGWRDVSFRLQDLSDINNWLGKSKWSSDYNSNVEYDEVRIYSSVLSWYDVYGHYLAGPDVPVNQTPHLDIANKGAYVRLVWPGNTIGMLQHADELGMPTVWSDVTNTVQNSTNGLSVVLQPSEKQAFYGLRK